ncbi:hypothetical protein [Methanocella conradii]|uniref:hypothetical protein n=1 Tax=Methanocella conradii TaxID=1175444 RepID=UPI0024B3BE5F|nr:hypothetical protein [Methanocella conradii]MDI6898165.1 hypothetical protein [Methanocella conradii]
MGKAMIDHKRLNELVEYAAIGLFIILSLLMIFRHVPWGDEAQAWLIARDCPDLLSVWHLMCYEGSPGLWHTILFSLAKLGMPYFSMTAIHFLFALTGVVIFMRCAPFSTLQKSLFIFGYFILFEYNVIARSYVLTVLFLFIIAAIYKKRFEHPLAYGALLFLLANANLYGTVVAIAIFIAYLYEAYNEKKLPASKYLMAGLAIAVIGILLAAWQVYPPADRRLSNNQSVLSPDFSPYHIGQVFNAVVEAFVPVPQLTHQFWGTKFLYYPTTAMAILGLPIFLLSLVFFHGKPVPMAIYLISALGLLGVFFFVNPGSIRHHGIIYIAFIFSLWISTSYGYRPLIQSAAADRIFNKKSLGLMLTILLAIQLLGGTIAFYYTINDDFSPGRAAAGFLIDNGYVNDRTFIATYKIGTNPILPYIPQPYSKFYSIEDQDYRSYIIWNDTFCQANLTPGQIMQRVDYATAGKHYASVLLILNTPIDDPEFAERYSLAAEFGNTISREMFYIYKLKA